MIRAALLLALATAALGMLLAYALLAILRPVEAVSVAFVFGILATLNAAATWRAIRRATHG